VANNPVMDRNPYFRGPTMPNGYPSQTQYGQQYDAYGQPVYGQQPGVNQFAGQQAYAPQAAGGGGVGLLAIESDGDLDAGVIHGLGEDGSGACMKANRGTNCNGAGNHGRSFQMRVCPS